MIFYFLVAELGPCIRDKRGWGNLVEWLAQQTNFLGFMNIETLRYRQTTEYWTRNLLLLSKPNSKDRLAHMFKRA
jgi:hypothetical protein